MRSDTQLSHKSLRKLAVAGDAPAVGQLLGLYRSYLSLLARGQIGRRLQARVDASDLVQETLLAASCNFEQFRGATEKELTKWLRQIMASKITDAVRRHTARKRDIRLEWQVAKELDRSSVLLGNALATSQHSPSEQVARREQAVLLAHALDKLSDDYREVLVLRHIEELSFQEVATRMDRTLDSVKKLWTRALIKLRQSIEKLNGSP